jgi:xylulokinase
MVPAVILLDADHRPLRRAILQNDARAVTEIVELNEQLADTDLVT